jgi:pyruvate formate lyase activating enzyme
MDVPPTPLATLLEARRVALDCGLAHVYVGNARHPEGEATFCRACGHLLLGRLGYRFETWNLDPGGACPACGERLAGVFGPATPPL